MTRAQLEVHDLLISKYVAGRDKDHAFCRATIRHGLADPSVLQDRLTRTALTPEARAIIADRIRADSAGA